MIRVGVGGWTYEPSRIVTSIEVNGTFDGTFNQEAQSPYLSDDGKCNEAFTVVHSFSGVDDSIVTAQKFRKLICR
jgi:hypothetical protein